MGSEVDVLDKKLQDEDSQQPCRRCRVAVCLDGRSIGTTQDEATLFGHGDVCTEALPARRKAGPHHISMAIVHCGHTKKSEAIIVTPKSRSLGQSMGWSKA